MKTILGNQVLCAAFLRQSKRNTQELQSRTISVLSRTPHEDISKEADCKIQVFTHHSPPEILEFMDDIYLVLTLFQKYLHF
jgi:hypothetical protein